MKITKKEVDSFIDRQVQHIIGRLWSGGWGDKHDHIAALRMVRHLDRIENPKTHFDRSMSSNFFDWVDALEELSTNLGEAGMLDKAKKVDDFLSFMLQLLRKNGTNDMSTQGAFAFAVKRNSLDTLLKSLKTMPDSDKRKLYDEYFSD